MTFGKRLEAARKFRGFISSSQAAAALGHDHRQYAMWELSTEVPAKVPLRTLADRFGITSAFLRHGRASTLADRWAESMVGSLKVGSRQWTLTERHLIAERLTTVRLARGFRVIRDAASFFSWSADIYADHEAGRRSFGKHQIETFAYAYDVPVEYFFDNQVGFQYSAVFAVSKTARDVQMYSNARFITSKPDTVWVETYASLSYLLEAMATSVRGASVPDTFTPMPVTTLRRYTTCNAKNLILLRHSFPTSVGPVELILKKTWIEPGGIEAMIFNQDGRLKLKISHLPHKLDGIDVKLRLPIILMMTGRQNYTWNGAGIV